MLLIKIITRKEIEKYELIKILYNIIVKLGVDPVIDNVIVPVANFSNSVHEFICYFDDIYGAVINNAIEILKHALSDKIISIQYLYL